MLTMADIISKYGFPIISSVACAYMIYYVWKWATQEIKPILKNASTSLIALIDRVRMLDNDLIRLTQKLDVALQLRDHAHDKITNPDKPVDKP